MARPSRVREEGNSGRVPVRSCLAQNQSRIAFSNAVTSASAAEDLHDASNLDLKGLALG
jgi:hypothetical protein